MAMQTIRNILQVFLASPSDLSEERRIAKQVVQEVNGIISRTMGWEVELLGWEDTLPGSARPQELINNDVEQCQLFVGLLWRRWGQETGIYSSGFQEEYEYARSRRGKTKLPEIWLFFKKVDSDLVVDPGEQLQKVLTFRKNLELSKELFFKEFDDSQGWEKLLRDHLLRHVIQLANAPQVSIETPMGASTMIPSPVPDSLICDFSEKPGSSALLPTQIGPIIEQISQTLSKGNIDLSQGDHMNEFDVSRIHLFTSARMSELIPNTLLQSQEINLLYRYKEDLELTESEERFIFRSLLSDSIGILPGWFWFQEAGKSRIIPRLFHHAVDDRAEEIREAALGLLTMTKISPPSDWDAGLRARILKKMVEDISPQVRKAGFSYIATIGNLQDLPLVNTNIDEMEDTVRSEADRARFLILSRFSPEEAISNLLVSSHSPSEEIIKELDQNSQRINTELLLEAINHPSPSVRAFAAKVLLRRRELTDDLVPKLKNDSSITIREIGYRELIKRGLFPDPKEVRNALKKNEGSAGFLSFGNTVDEEALLLTLYRSHTKEQLQTEVDWLSFDGPIAYRALALDYFHEMADIIRDDLNNNFQRIKGALIERLKYVEAAEEMLAGIEKFDEMIKMRFTEAALGSLAIHGNPNDIHAARRCLLNTWAQVQLPAIQVVAKFGDESDVGILLEIAGKNYGEIAELAAKAAVRLSSGNRDAAIKLIESQKNDLIITGLKSIRGEDPNTQLNILEPILESSDTNKRRKVLAHLVKILSDEQLGDLLARYLERDYYYFQVVCWLDRVLYSPEPLREMFMKSLESEIN